MFKADLPQLGEICIYITANFLQEIKPEDFTLYMLVNESNELLIPKVEWLAQYTSEYIFKEMEFVYGKIS
jgi:ribulose kinase